MSHFNTQSTYARQRWIQIVLILILVFPTMAVGLSISGPDRVCPGGSYQYTPNDNDVLIKCDYTWSVLRNGVVIRTGTTKNFNYVVDFVQGTVTVQLTLSRGIGCISKSTVTKSVLVDYPTPNPISGPYNLVANSASTFSTGSDTCPSGSYGLSGYRWSVPVGWLINGQPGPVNTSGIVSIKPPATANGGYQISVQGYYQIPFGNPTQYSPVRTYNVLVTSQLPINVEIVGTEYVNSGQPTTWTSNVSGGTGTYSYQWEYNTFGYWNPSDQLTPSFTYTPHSGMSTIQLRLTVFSGTGQSSDTHTAYCMNCQMQQFSVSPNPASKSLKVDMSQVPADYSIKIFNSRGEMVREVTGIKKDEVEIEVADLPKGLYVLKIISTGEAISKRVLVEH